MKQIALLYGINVGGAGKLPMAGFRALLEELGLQGVHTYIQSGNAVFESDLSAQELEVAIPKAISRRFGLAPETFVRTAEEMAAALRDHPFADADPSRVHVFFLRKTPAPDEASLRALALPGDSWHVGPCRFTLHTPDGIGRSKLARTLDKLLPRPMTARNLRTVAALVQMSGADS